MSTPARSWATPRRAAILSVAFFLAAQLGGLLSRPGSFATVWPPSGLLLAALLQTPPRRWLVVIAATLPANLAFDLLHDHSLALGLGYWSGNCVEAALGAVLVARAVGAEVGFTRVREVAAFVGLAGIVSPAVGATIGATVAVVGRGGAYWPQWGLWWLSDVLGVLLVAPLVLGRRRADRPVTGDREWIGFLGATAVLALLIALRGQFAPNHISGGVAMILFPMVVWGAWRFGARGAAVVLLLVAVVGLWNHRLGRGLFDGAGNEARSALALEAFFAVAAVTFLTLSALATELADANRELAAARAAAQAASRFKSDFLASMSHEVRNPLTAIVGYTDLLLEAEVPPDEQRAWVEKIRDCSVHLRGVVSDTLDLSKIEAGRLEVERLPCSPVRLVEEVVAVMGAQARAKGLRLDVEYEQPLPAEIRTDPGRVRQILLNLVGNALKFTLAGGVRIRVGLSAVRSDLLRIDVTDSGIGIAPAVLARLGEPFVQADASVGRRFGGTGLGLAITKRLVHLLGGDLMVESRPGQGSTFSITLETGASTGPGSVPASPATRTAASC